jgi:hypothetical protein
MKANKKISISFAITILVVLVAISLFLSAVYFHLSLEKTVSTVADIVSPENLNNSIKEKDSIINVLTKDNA